MNIFSRSLAMALCGLCLVVLAACRTSTPPAPLPLPDLSIGLAPFTQPVRATQLMAGFIPEVQGLATADERLTLDGMLEDRITATGRPFTMVSLSALSGDAQEPQGRRSALAMWVQLARDAGVDLLIVPQVIDWKQRNGGPAGVVSPAGVTVDFFLVDARGEGALLQRSHYAVVQTALSDNLLTMRSFFQRGGRWVTAEDLSGEGMDRAIREFGL